MGYPAVTKEETKNFAKRWDKGGIKVILDDASIQFATDWANIALRSFVDQMAQAALAKKQAQANPAPAPKSSIVLTDK